MFKIVSTRKRVAIAFVVIKNKLAPIPISCASGDAFGLQHLRIGKTPSVSQRENRLIMSVS